MDHNSCDKYDYLAAIACGALGGMIDIFLVGSPLCSPLGGWTDQMVDQTVKNFAKKMGWNSSSGNVNSAIGYLEREFPVNYDQRLTSEVGNAFTIAPKTHHMMSLAHSPDIVGLFFSVLNQFTSTSTFIAGGRPVTIQTGTYELIGGNFLAKLFCGITNWFGHIMSDIAGSSGSHGRGTGIVLPFYEFFGLCKFGKFGTGDVTKDLSQIAMHAYTEGYDSRHGMAMAIPVAVTNYSIDLIWALRRYFQYGYSLKDCIPTSRHRSLRTMRLVGNGTLCAMDAMDAKLKSGFNPVRYFLHLNLIAWFRLAVLVLKELCIRVGIEDGIQSTIDALKVINAAVADYLEELKRIDIERFKEETARYNSVTELFSRARTEDDLQQGLMDFYDKNGFSLPWEGDFNSFMSDRNNTLVFQ